VGFASSRKGLCKKQKGELPFKKKCEGKVEIKQTGGVLIKKQGLKSIQPRRQKKAWKKQKARNEKGNEKVDKNSLSRQLTKKPDFL